MLRERINAILIGDITQVQITRDESIANNLLRDGWILLNAGVSHTDSAGYQAKPHFILGKKREEDK